MLAAGQCVGLSAPSGAGKTRLLRAMADLDAHTGECRLDGRSACDFTAPEWRRRVMFLAAESAWWADTVSAHLPASDDDYRVLCHALDLAPALLARPPSRLSSGQRQRAALLRMLAARPDVLLLDEPTANLDSANISRVEAAIAAYRKERGACAVWAGHDRGQLSRVAEVQIALDDRGQPMTDRAENHQASMQGYTKLHND